MTGWQWKERGSRPTTGGPSDGCKYIKMSSVAASDLLCLSVAAEGCDDAGSGRRLCLERHRGPPERLQRGRSPLLSLRGDAARQKPQFITGYRLTMTPCWASSVAHFHTVTSRKSSLAMFTPVTSGNFILCKS